MRSLAVHLYVKAPTDTRIDTYHVSRIRLYVSRISQCQHNVATLRVDIGPRVQNDPKSPQIQPSFRVDFGSPFVHLTRFHRGSESFSGARLFTIAILVPDSTMLLRLDPERTFFFSEKNRHTVTKQKIVPAADHKT